jgi:hypothetical protein
MLALLSDFWNRLGWWAFRMDRMFRRYESEHPEYCAMCSYYRFLNREYRYLGPPPPHECRERRG